MRALDPLPIAARTPAARDEVHRALPDADIILDVSRLLSRNHLQAPTGVDRVEMAYVQRLLARAPDRLTFAALHPVGLYGRLPTDRFAAFVERTANIWRGESPRGSAFGERLAAIAAVARLTPLAPGTPITQDARPRVYLQVSPHHLDRPRAMRKILARERARLVCLVHDLIPIEYPEYARPNGSALHAKRMRTVADLADGVIVASDASRQSFLNHVGEARAGIRIRTAALGADLPPPRMGLATDQASPPYFVIVGTIEPRKNHLLLLNLWRDMARTLGPRAIPKLIVVGRRGWENENILDMLDRSRALKGVVEEIGHAPDEQVQSLVRGARAVLMPSFAEGFGLPVIEALQAGTPVLCSDLPAHREAAGDVAEFLDPLDGLGWRRAILDYAAPVSARRDAQQRRLIGWRAPTWDAHIDAALDLIGEIVG